jgi:hypothetical protein
MSKQAVKDEFIATGHKPKDSKSFQLELSELSEKDRAVIIDWLDNHADIDLSYMQVVDGSWRTLSRAKDLYYDSEPTVDQVIMHMHLAQAEARTIAAAKAERKHRQEKETKRRINQTEMIDAAARVGLDAVKALKLGPAEHKVMSHYRSVVNSLTTAQREVEKGSWIAGKGSPHLRRAAERGYDCQRAYVVERAQMEAPQFTVDFNNGAEWKDRCCPSEQALVIEDQGTALELDAETPITVWLTAAPSNDVSNDYDNYGYCEEFTPCEAVVMRRYLGKYDLVRIV